MQELFFNKHLSNARARAYRSRLKYLLKRGVYLRVRKRFFAGAEFQGKGEGFFALANGL